MINEIALLGQDGIGKSSLSNEVVRHFGKKGRKVHITSWTKATSEGLSDFGRSCMSDLYVATYRGMYAGAQTNTGPASTLIPLGKEQFFSDDIAKRLSEVDITANKSWGLIAAALAELSGNFFFRFQEIEPRIAGGDLVLQETYGYKHLVKEIFLARELAIQEGNKSALDFLNILETMNEQVFSNGLAPQIGFVVDGDPELAFKWRMAQSGNAGVTEDMQLVADNSQRSYVKMQNHCRSKFLEFGKKNDWAIIKMEDRPIKENIERAIEVIEASCKKLYIPSSEVCFEQR